MKKLRNKNPVRIREKKLKNDYGKIEVIKDVKLLIVKNWTM